MGRRHGYGQFRLDGMVASGNEARVLKEWDCDMNRDEISSIVKETVKEVLERLGVDPDDPIAMQKDFAHVRAWRESTEAIKRKGLMAAVGVIVTGVLGAIWLGFKDSLPWH